MPALLILALVLGLGLAHSLRQRRADALAAEAASEVVPWIDPATAEVLASPTWADPRWLERVAALLAELEPCEARSPHWIEPLRTALSSLSFVERVERCELGPAGLALELVLRRPVACIPVGGEFALVDEDGVVLEGRWPLPPRLGKAHLPVLGPLEDPLFARARAGDWLVEPEHIDALDVALSLALNLDEDERAVLGRIVIDAHAARRVSVAEPGVRLELEGQRLALFGRAPSSAAPGELAARHKWRALARAHELFTLDPVGGDWELVDLRWDRPDLALRNPPVVAEVRPAAPRVGGTRVSTSRSRAASEEREGLDASRPRVR